MMSSRKPGKDGFVFSCIALKKGVSQKEVGVRIAAPDATVSRLLKKDRLDEGDRAKAVLGTGATPSEVAAATACWEALEPDPELTDEERAVIESEILERSRLDRRVFKQMALRSREAPPAEVYPEAADVEPARWRAAGQLERLRELDADGRLAAAKVAPELHNWALCVEAAEESRRAASQDLEEAAAWARVAVVLAERVRGPEEWRRRLLGMALAVEANVRRVEGRLKAARAGLRRAEPLWFAGSDPLQILDPALLLDLDASLCRAERRFDVALDRLEKALRIGRCRERYLVNKGSILAVMGEYERALEALLATQPDRDADPRLWYQHRFNIAVTCSHLERHAEAEGLLPEVRAVATALRDRIFLSRVTWLEGRLAAGLGRTQEALGLLERARLEFHAREMSYDVALALLETLALLLGEGRTAEVKALAPSLAELFTAEGIHREALVALRIFHEAVEAETATADLARRVLRFLFRARQDQGLRFDLG